MAAANPLMMLILRNFNVLWRNGSFQPLLLKCEPLWSITRRLVYAAISVAMIAYICTSYPLHRIDDIPLAQLKLRELVNNVGFLLATSFGIILGGGIIHASFQDNVDDDRGSLLVALTLVFFFQRSEDFITLGGYALRAIEAVVAWLTTGFVGRIS